MAVSQNKRRLLRLLKYLYEKTDNVEELSTKELEEYLKSEGFSADRHTITDDVMVMVEEGFPILIEKAGQNRYSYCPRTFSLVELKVMVDAVSSARFISEKTTDRLIEELKTLASEREQKLLMQHLYTSGKLKADVPEIEETILIVNAAIDAERKLIFRYTDYNLDMTKSVSEEVYKISPYVMVWSNDHYYVVGFSDKLEKLAQFRIDRMYHPEVTQEAGVKQPEGYDINEYIRHMDKMFSGERIDVTLVCENHLLKNIVDRFGTDIHPERVDDQCFRVDVQAMDSPTFYSWIFQFKGEVCIAGPEDIRKEYREMLLGVLKAQDAISL